MTMTLLGLHCELSHLSFSCQCVSFGVMYYQCVVNREVALRASPTRHPIGQPYNLLLYHLRELL